MRETHTLHTAGGAIVERGDAHALPRAARDAKRLDRGDRRYAITVTARRTRLLDADNVVAKFAIDALRYCGVIPNDDARFIASLEIRQIKCNKGETPETIVEIEEVEGNEE